MSGPRIVCLCASIFFVGVIVVGGVIDVAGYVTTPRAFPKEQITKGGVLNGESELAIETWLRDESTIAKTIRPVYNEFLFTLAKTAPQDTVVGRDMLFDLLRVQPHEPRFWNRVREGVVNRAVDLQRALAPCGGRLLVLMVPDTIRVYPDQLPDLHFENSPKAPHYREVIRDLEAHGVAALDLVEILTAHARKSGERVYRRDDHHWNRFGCRAVAEAAADWMRQNGFSRKDHLGLQAPTIEGTNPSRSMLKRTGWQPGSTLYRQFEDAAIFFDVRDPAGQPYDELWKTDVVVAADSFGHTFAPLVAMAADQRVAGITLAGKGPLYSVFEVLRGINEGWRPKVVIWLFEERASYVGEEILFEYGSLAAAVPDARKGLREHRIPMASVQMGSGASGKAEPTFVRLRNDSRIWDLRLPRPAEPASHLVVYVLPAWLEHRETEVALLDSKASATDIEAIRLAKAVLLDRRQGIWQRLVLPIPPGSGDLVLAFHRNEIGGEFWFTSFGWLSTADAPAQPTVRAKAPIAATGVEVIVQEDRFSGEGVSMDDKTRFPDPRLFDAHFATSVTSRARFEDDSEVAAEFPATLIVDGTSCPTPEPIVFTFRSDVKPGGPETIESQTQVNVEPGRRIEVALPPVRLPDGSGQGRRIHLAEIRMTPAAEMHAIVAIRFGDRE